MSWHARVSAAPKYHKRRIKSARVIGIMSAVFSDNFAFGAGVTEIETPIARYRYDNRLVTFSVVRVSQTSEAS